MTAPSDWLTDERPPLPRRERPVIFDDEFAARFAEALREDDPVSGDLFETAEFRPVKPLRWSKQWWVENLSFSRVIAGGASGLALIYGFLGWVQ